MLFRSSLLIMNMSMDQDFHSQDPWLRSMAIRFGSHQISYCTVHRKATKPQRNLYNQTMAKSASDAKSTKSLKSSASLKSLKATAKSIVKSVKHKAAQIISPKKTKRTKTMASNNDDHQSDISVPRSVRHSSTIDSEDDGDDGGSDTGNVPKKAEEDAEAQLGESKVIPQT